MYELSASAKLDWPVQMLCDTQIQNDRRRIILGSIVRIYNNTKLPLVILNVDSTNPAEHSRIARIGVNQDYCMPIDLLYKYSNCPIFFGIDE